MNVTASATIIRGAKTNRVKQVKPHGKRGRPADGSGRKRETSVQKALRENSSGSYVVISVSLYPEELAAMDALARRVQMNRSQLIRRAVERMAAFVAPNPEQESRWREALGTSRSVRASEELDAIGGSYVGSK